MKEEKAPELLDMLIASSQYGTDMERYKDFREVFFGSEQGQRVFKEILGMGYMLNTTVKYNKYGVDTNATLITTGERKLALLIHKTATHEPAMAPPKRQTKKRR